ncbi:hypothetical protein XAUC_01670 [Xanthomonas citri pv. aurantifolii str. ICPB 10535]|nr:hypothetical protein XAUC_01670 [Xanthomonas citri pv. aurantifolii str. ICPB 10535]
MLDRKTLQRRVALLDVGVAAATEIRAMDGGTRQRVANALLRIVVSREQRTLRTLGQLGKGLCAGIGDRATDTQHLLKLPLRIDEDGIFFFGQCMADDGSGRCAGAHLLRGALRAGVDTQRAVAAPRWRARI